MNKAGNCINHPETIQPDPHTPGSPLPRALLHNSVGYLPDGTPMNAAGNAVNHPDRMQPDMHVAGSPLPKSVYCADVGYLVDGTDLATAGNNSVKVPFEAQTDVYHIPSSSCMVVVVSKRLPVLHLMFCNHSCQSDIQCTARNKSDERQHRCQNQWQPPSWERELCLGRAVLVVLVCFFVSKAVHFSLNHGYSSFLYERSSPMHMSFLFVQSEQFPLV